MATPSDLIAHYSSKALYTRLAALTLVGGLVGGAWNKLDDLWVSQIVGFAVIVVVASLGELNRRYTHSYLTACKAAAAYVDGESADAKAAAQRWAMFRDLNEARWQRAGWRFLVNWLTYLPGLMLGVFLAGRECGRHFWYCPSALIALALSTLIVLLWIKLDRIPR